MSAVNEVIYFLDKEKDRKVISYIDRYVEYSGKFSFSKAKRERYKQHSSFINDKIFSILNRNYQLENFVIYSWRVKFERLTAYHYIPTYKIKFKRKVG